MNQIVFQEPILFRYLFSTMSRFVDILHFDINENEVQIKSIDSHDVCYLNLHMSKNFFKEYNIEKNMSFGINISKIRSFLPKVSDAKEFEFLITDDYMELIASKDWKMSFRIEILDKDPYNLPEPKEIKYDSYVTLNAYNFSRLIDAASTISSELIFSVENKNFLVKANSGDYTFIGQPSQILELNGNLEKMESIVISKYLSFLAPLIKRCDQVRIKLGIGKPVRIDLLYKNKAIFSFIYSQRRLPRISIDSKSTGSLPSLTSSRLPELLLYLYNKPEGEKINVLIAMGLETKEQHYSKIVNKLNLISYHNEIIQISNNGINFVNLINNNINMAKGNLHEMSFSKIEDYRLLINAVKEKTLTPNEVFMEINRTNEIQNIIEKEYLNVLLGIAIWCNIIDKKLALYYFAK